MAYSVLEIFLVPLMRCISPFDNGSYHMDTIRTNRTNRQLGQGRQASLSIQRVGNILSPLMRCILHSTTGLLRMDDSTATAQLFYDSYLFRCIGQPSLCPSERNSVCDLHCRIRVDRRVNHNPRYSHRRTCGSAEISPPQNLLA